MQFIVLGHSVANSHTATNCSDDVTVQIKMKSGTSGYIRLDAVIF